MSEPYNSKMSSVEFAFERISLRRSASIFFLASSRALLAVDLGAAVLGWTWALFGRRPALLPLLTVSFFTPSSPLASCKIYIRVLLTRAMLKVRVKFILFILSDNWERIELKNNNSTLELKTDPNCSKLEFG